MSIFVHTPWLKSFEILSNVDFTIGGSTENEKINSNVIAVQYTGGNLQQPVSLALDKDSEDS